MRAQLAHGHHLDRAAARVAARQYGLITRPQALSLGVDRGRIARRLASGRWHQVHRGVYAVGHLAPRIEARWLAAVLACGPGAVLSHASAAHLWAIKPAPARDLPHVTVDTRVGRARRGIVVHRAQLAPQDIVRSAGIPVTSPARTLVDLAGELPERALKRALREAQFQRIVTLADIGEVLARRPAVRLRALVGDPAVTQTDLEDRLLAICDANALPRPLTQQRLSGKRVDFVWPAARLVVETDGWQAHATRGAFQDDRTLSNALQLRGYIVLRFTADDLDHRRRDVARQIRRALAEAAHG